MRVVRIKMTENGMDEQFSQFKEKKKAIRAEREAKYSADKNSTKKRE